MRLSHDLDETSGAAFSLDEPGIIWTLNDGGNPAELLALDMDGDIKARIRVDARNRDWEALDRGWCDAESSLSIARRSTSHPAPKPRSSTSWPCGPSGRGRKRSLRITFSAFVLSIPHTKRRASSCASFGSVFRRSCPPFSD